MHHKLKKRPQYGKKLPVEDDENKIIGISPAISRTLSPIYIQI